MIIRGKTQYITSIPFEKLCCGCLNKALLIISHQQILHIKNKSGKSCGTADWDKLTPKYKPDVHTHTHKKVMCTMLLLNPRWADLIQLWVDWGRKMKTKRKGGSKTETVPWKRDGGGETTTHCFYLPCLGRDRLIAAAADKGLLFPLYSAIWPGPVTAAPLSAF